MASAVELTIQELIDVGCRLDLRGLAPATSGNYSARVDGERIAITVSGSHKGRLRPADVMLVDLQGHALDGRTPSAETPLHTAVYQMYPSVNAVLHVHSVAAVTLTRFLPESSDVTLDGYELLKALPGIRTHEARIDIPILDNSQDTVALGRLVASRLKTIPSPHAILIRGHGINTWGTSVLEAERVFEALEHLFKCELQLLQLHARGKV
jgi:methylthioribulose-1-phosphate dehydratase